MISLLLSIINTETQPQGDVVVGIIGQSNALADLSYGPPSAPELNGPLEKAKIWNNNQWETLEYGVNNLAIGDQTGLTGAGSELRIGYELGERYGSVYIVKHALGGTALGNEIGTLNDWSPSGVLYQQFIDKMHNAVGSLNNFRYYGLLWNQWERDVTVEYLFQNNTYRVNTIAFVEDRLRKDLIKGSNVKFAHVRANTHRTSEAAIVRQNIIECASLIEGYDWIDIDDAALNNNQGYVNDGTNDDVHYTELWQDLIGQRFIAKIDAL